MTGSEQLQRKKTCQSCGSKEPRWAPRYPHLALYSCAECESFTFLSEETIDSSSLYSKDYFTGGEYRDYVGHRRVHEINFEKKWRIISRYMSSPPRLFELGCAYGFFVNYAKNAGAEKVFGTDVSDDGIKFAKEQFGPHFAISSESVLPPFSYNCLVAWDVWEHLDAPFDFFSKYVNALEPGGIFAIATIDSSSVVARLRGEKWRQIHPPTHLHYPTMRGINRAMKALGLEVLFHSHIGQHRALEQYLVPLKLDGLIKRFETLRTLPIPLDLKDEQIIVARKPGGN